MPLVMHASQNLSARLDLLHGLELVASIVATGRATMPFPRGFRLLPQMPEFARSVVVGPAV